MCHGLHPRLHLQSQCRCDVHFVIIGVWAITSRKFVWCKKYFRQLLPMTQRFVNIFLMVKSSQGYTAHDQNWCLGHNFSLVCRTWMVFNTIVAQDSMMCHNLHSMTFRSHLQSLQTTHMVKMDVQVITSYWSLWSGWYPHNVQSKDFALDGIFHGHSLHIHVLNTLL